MRLREGFFAESVVTGAAAAGAPKRPPAGAAAAGAPKRPVAGVAVRVSAGAGGAAVAPNRLPPGAGATAAPVSYTHLRAHETLR